MLFFFVFINFCHLTICVPQIIWHWVHVFSSSFAMLIRIKMQIGSWRQRRTPRSTSVAPSGWRLPPSMKALHNITVFIPLLLLSCGFCSKLVIAWSFGTLKCFIFGMAFHCEPPQSLLLAPILIDATIFPCVLRFLTIIIKNVIFVDTPPSMPPFVIFESPSRFMPVKPVNA